MVFQNCQDMGQITERIQVIRLCCFCYAIDDRAGFRASDTVDQLPRMFSSSIFYIINLAAIFARKIFIFKLSKFELLTSIFPYFTSFQEICSYLAVADE